MSAISAVLSTLICPLTSLIPSDRRVSSARINLLYSPQSPSLSGAIRDSANDGKSENALRGDEWPEDDLDMNRTPIAMLASKRLRKMHWTHRWIREVAINMIRVALPQALRQEHMHRLAQYQLARIAEQQ